jgi:endonuclease III
LQDLVAPRDRYRLHVNLVVHGQRTCLPRTPKCNGCVLRRTCPTARLGFGLTTPRRATLTSRT